MVSWRGYGPQIQPYGCTFHEDGIVEFGVWAPCAVNPKIVFNDGTVMAMEGSPKPDLWRCRFPMEKLKELMAAKTPLTYHYEFESSWNDCYQTEGAVLKRRDPCARLTDFDSNECFVPIWESPVLCPESPFFVKDDQRPTWENSALTIYELHVGSFPKIKAEYKNCFETIPLDHISGLGFNAVELMPIQEFGGSWGYNPRLLMALHPPFGTPCDLRSFITKCHHTNVKVILDVVLNHGSAKRNSLWNYDGYGPDNNGGIYFQHGKETGWGRQFDFCSSQVLHYIKMACIYFLEKMNVDGLRFDSVHNMRDGFVKELLMELKKSYPDRIFIAEVTPEDPRVCKELGFDAVWVHANYYDAYKLLKERGSPWDMQMLINIVNGHKHFESGSQMISSILGSHDQVGNRHGGHSDDHRIGRYMVDQLGGRENWHARAQTRMLFALQGFGRQIPMVFQGSEILQGGWWNIDPEHHWSYYLVENKDPHTSQYMAMVKDVNALRAMSSALQAVKPGVEICHADAHNLVIGALRCCEKDQYLIVVNWSESQWEGDVKYLINTPWKSQQVHPIFNSQAEEYGGWEGSWTTKKTSSGTREPLATSVTGSLALTLPKWSVLLFRAEIAA